MKLRLLLLTFSILISLSFHSYAMDQDKELLRLISGQMILDLIHKKQNDFLKYNENTPELEGYVASAKRSYEMLTNNAPTDILNQFEKLKPSLTTEKLDYNVTGFLSYFHKESAK